MPQHHLQSTQHAILNVIITCGIDLYLIVATSCHKHVDINANQQDHQVKHCNNQTLITHAYH